MNEKEKERKGSWNDGLFVSVRKLNEEERKS